MAVAMDNLKVGMKVALLALMTAACLVGQMVGMKVVSTDKRKVV